MVVRISRILNLTRHKGVKITDDARIALRWLLSTPAGETRFGDGITNNICGLDLDDGGQEFPRSASSFSVKDSDDSEPVATES